MFSFLRRVFYFDNWPIVLFQRLFDRRARLLAFRRGKIEFMVDYSGGDQCGILQCLTSDMYSRFFGDFETNRPLRILDLGANAGGFCLALAAAGFEFEKLICVEMNRRTCQRLQLNISQNFECQAIVLNAAIASHGGAIRIRDSHGGTSESIYAQAAAGEKTVEVPLVTFDGLGQSHFGGTPNAIIDICKMDIEGAEHEVFHSATCHTIRSVKYLIIEIHPQPSTSEAALITKIGSFGFELAAKATPGKASVHLFRNTTL